MTQFPCALHFQLCNHLSYVPLLIFSVRANDLSLEIKEPAFGGKLYIYILQPNRQVVLSCNALLMYYPGTSILDLSHIPKKCKVKCHRWLHMHSIIMPCRLQKMLHVVGRRFATVALPLTQLVVARVMCFHHLFAGASQRKIRVGNELGDMRHQYMGLRRFLYNETTITSMKGC